MPAEANIKTLPNCDWCKDQVVEENSKFCNYCGAKFLSKLKEVIPEKYIAEGLYLSKLPIELKNYYYLTLGGADKSFNGKGLYLWGNTGIGKSFATWTFVKELILARQEVESIDTSEFLNRLRAGFSISYLAKENYIYVERLKRVPFLIIDDICAEKSSPFVEETMFNIINARYNKGKITLITSNFSFTEMAENRLGDRIASRLNEMCKIIHLTGDDRRIKKESIS
jgi:DNA replication protein DnaC